MADPLSITAGVVGVAAGGIALASRLHDLVDRFGGALADIEGIASELNFFSIVLDELSKILNVPASQQIASDQLMMSIREIMEKCKLVFKEINQMIAKANGAKKGGLANFKTKVKWVFRDTRVRSVKATLESLKATLGLMLQTLRLAKNDESDQMQRAILQNMLKTQESSVKVLQSIDKEEGSSSILPGESEAYTPLLPGIPVQHKSSSPVGMTRSTSVLLSSAVPHVGRQKRETSQGKYPKYADPALSYPSQTSQDSPDYFSSNSNASGRYSPLPTRSPPPIYRPYDSKAWDPSSPPTQPTYPFESDDYGAGGEGMAIGIPAPVLQKSDIDHLLSNWVHRPGLQSQKNNTHNQSYSHVPSHSLDIESQPSFTSEKDPYYHAFYNPEQDQPKSPAIHNGKFTAPVQYSEPEMKAIEDLKKKRDEIQEQLRQYKTNTEILRKETREKSAKESELLLQTSIRARETNDDKQRFEIEKDLMHCEAEQEKQSSILQELQRCREEYATRMREQPSQSHETLGRHIQTMEDRLGNNWFGEASLSDVRKGLLNRLKAIQKEYETSIADFQTEHEARLKEIEKTEGFPDESEKEIEKSLGVVVLELSNLEDGLKKKWEATAQYSDTVSNGYKDSFLNRGQYTETSKTFKAPDWLSEGATEIYDTWDDDTTAYSSTENIDLGEDYFEAQSNTQERERPGYTTKENSYPTGSRTPTTELPYPSSPSSGKFTMPDNLDPNTVNGSWPSQQIPPPTQSGATRPKFRSASATVIPTQAQQEPPLILCRRPAWKPPATHLTGTNTLSSVLSLTPHKLLYFKASQDAYHFFLSSSPDPFYIVELIPSDLTTFQTSLIQWTVIPKLWASKSALEVIRYDFEEDVHGQVWIRKELNWHQILQLFDFSCGFLDSRLNTASRHVLEKRAEDKAERSRTPTNLFSRFMGQTEASILRDLHGGFFDTR